MKIMIALVFLIIAGRGTYAQAVITLEECYQRAEANYPLLKQKEMIDQTREFTVANAVTGNMPQVMIGGQATYQSDVTRIPVEMPGIEPLSKDQYKIFAEISQTLYQGGLVTAQRKDAEVTADIDHTKLTVDLYQLRHRINDLFFGILLLTEQTRQSELVKEDLKAGLRKLEASVANGTALPTAVDVLQAELLSVDQRIIEMQAAEKSYREVLGRFIAGRPLHHTLQRPEFGDLSSTVERPELALFDAERKGIESRQALLSARRKPGVQLFFQGGYGRPGLNMLENEFDFYYLGGVRFTWFLSGYYTHKREQQILDVRQRSLEIQKETFLFNTDLVLTQHETGIRKLRRLIEVDDEIVKLRSGIRETAAVQLREGVITATDFIRDVNAEDQAKQSRALHEIQLLKAQADYYFTSGHQ